MLSTINPKIDERNIIVDATTNVISNYFQLMTEATMVFRGDMPTCPNSKKSHELRTIKGRHLRNFGVFTISCRGILLTCMSQIHYRVVSGFKALTCPSINFSEWQHIAMTHGRAKPCFRSHVRAAANEANTTWAPGYI